jgi:hypothetical protein
MFSNPPVSKGQSFSHCRGFYTPGLRRISGSVLMTAAAVGSLLFIFSPLLRRCRTRTDYPGRAFNVCVDDDEQALTLRLSEQCKSLLLVGMTQVRNEYREWVTNVAACYTAGGSAPVFAVLLSARRRERCHPNIPPPMPPAKATKLRSGIMINGVANCAPSSPSADAKNGRNKSTTPKKPTIAPKTPPTIVHRKRIILPSHSIASVQRHNGGAQPRRTAKRGTGGAGRQRLLGD